VKTSYRQLKAGSEDLREAFAAKRSAANLRTRHARRRASEDAAHEARARHRRRRVQERELEKILRHRVRVQIPEKGRKQFPTRYRKRSTDWSEGVAGTATDSRGPDQLHSLYFSFTPRGFGSRSGRPWRRGEASRAGLYIVREDALECSEHGWWSNFADDRRELSAFLKVLEEVESHDRINANVYVTEIIPLPAELTARQRRAAARRICQPLAKLGLPYVVASHVPDRGGDRRNFHCHLIYSMRPFERHGAFDWSFDLKKVDDLCTPTAIAERRRTVIRALNASLHAAHVDKRYALRSRAERNMGSGQAKIGKKVTWSARRARALEERERALLKLRERIAAACHLLTASTRCAERLTLLSDRIADLTAGRHRLTLLRSKSAPTTERLRTLQLRCETESVARRAQSRALLQQHRDRHADAQLGLTSLHTRVSRQERLDRVRKRADRTRQHLRRIAAVIASLQALHLARLHSVQVRQETLLSRLADQLLTVTQARSRLIHRQRLHGLTDRKNATEIRSRHLLADVRHSLRLRGAKLTERAAHMRNLVARRRSLAEEHQRLLRLTATVGRLAMIDARLSAIHGTLQAALAKRLRDVRRRMEDTPFKLTSLAQQHRRAKAFAALPAPPQPMPASAVPRDDVDPARTAAIAAFVAFIDNTPTVRVFNDGGVQRLDPATIPTEWHRSMTAFDEQPEVQAALARKLADDARFAEMRAIMQQSRDRKVRMLIDALANATERPVLEFDGQLVLLPQAVPPALREEANELLGDARVVVAIKESNHLWNAIETDPRAAPPSSLTGARLIPPPKPEITAGKTSELPIGVLRAALDRKKSKGS
jgi:hypothetical protein